MSFDYSPRLADVLVIVLGLVVGIGISIFVFQPSASQTPDVSPATDLAFSFVSWPPTYLFTWGVESGTVETPPGIDFEPTIATPGLRDAEHPDSKFIRGEADLALVLPYQIPQISAQRPDASIVPYALATPTDMHNVVVPSDSSITEPAHLAGTRIASTPQSISSALTLIALEERYGVNASTIDLVMTWDPVGMLENGSVSAAIYSRYPDPGTRSVLQPFTYFREEYGEDASFGGFIVKRERPPGVINTSRNPGEAVVRTLLESGRQGAQNVPTIIDYYEDRQTLNFGDIEALVSGMADATGGEILVPIAEEHEQGMQRLYDRAYTEGIVEYQVNISALIDED